MGSFSQRTPNVTALWEWHRRFWAGTMAAFCRAPQCKMPGQQPAAQTFGALQTAFRNASPFRGLDLDTLEGFNFHKVLNTYALKNRDAGSLSCAKPCLVPFSECGVKKSQSNVAKDQSIKRSLFSVVPISSVCPQSLSPTTPYTSGALKDFNAAGFKV